MTNMSCSMMTTESPGISSRTMRRSRISSAVSSGFIPADGSSSRSSRGPAASARQISTRRRSICGSWPTRSKPRRGRSRLKRASRWDARSMAARISPTSRPRRTTESRSPVRRRACMPIRMLSKTERSRHRRLAWKVRAIPSRAIAWASRPVSRRPRKTTSPAAGAKRPVNALKSVVFPEPFGPITPTVSPSATTTSTPSRATSPPKRTVSPVTSSKLTVVAGAARPVNAVGGLPWVRRGSVRPTPATSPVSPDPRGPEAAGTVEEHDDDHDAVEEQAVLVEESEALGQGHEQAGAQHDARDRVHAADDDHGEHDERIAEVEVGRRDEAHHDGVTAEGEGRDVLDPLRAAREPEVVHEDVEDEDERDRDERQIVAARLEDRHEENRAHEDGRPRPDQHGEPRRPAPRDGQEADGVAAEASERGAGEVDDAGGPDLEIQPLTRRDVEKGEGRDEGPVRARPERQRKGQRQHGATRERGRPASRERPGERRAEPRHEPHQAAGRDERPAGGAERPRALGEDAGDHEREDGRLRQPDTREVAAHTRSTLFSPRRPLGLNPRNSMTTANATTSRNSEPRGMRAAAVGWRTPRSTATLAASPIPGIARFS